MSDVTVTAGDVRPLNGAIILRRTAGGSINIGDAVYLNSSGNAVQTAAGTDTIGSALVVGVAVATPDGSGGTVVASGQHVDVVVFGPVAGFSSLAEGSHHWVSANAGKIADARAGTTYFNYIVGVAWDSTTLLVHPDCEALAAQS